MGSRNDQRDWDDLPLQRARQPLGPDGIAQRRSRPLQRSLGSKRRYSPQSKADPAYKAARQRPGASSSQPGRRPDDGSRSRFVALLVLVVAAVILIIGGIVTTTGGIGSGSTVSISILPFPQSTDTTLAQ